MGLYERIKEVASQKGYSINRLERELEYPRSSISKYNKNVPSMEKIQKIAEFLNVPISEIIQSEKETDNAYYLNEETGITAQEIFEKDRVLFDVYRSADKDKLVEYAEMLKALREKEEGN